MTKSLSTPKTNKPWARSWQEVLEALDVSAESGLDTAEMNQRRKQYGSNRLRHAQSRRAWLILADQFKSLIVMLLVVAAALSFAFGEWVDGIAIMVVIAINTAIPNRLRLSRRRVKHE
jgi:Ca2+-transporting ATPase